VNIYQAGVVLLDLHEPWKLVARGAFNILEPRTPWELTGQVPNVVFPSGMCVDAFDEEGFALPDSPVRIYYGAADTVVGRASSTIAELIEDAKFEG
jgi:beta-1,4-mannooligosaccharide/beta-1,4-mannosyl-N-acetylglucosamine phosphorylase